MNCASSFGGTLLHIFMNNSNILSTSRSIPLDSARITLISVYSSLVRNLVYITYTMCTKSVFERCTSIASVSTRRGRFPLNNLAICAR